jgi:surface antigen
MSVRRNSSRTNVNSAYNTAAVQTSNSKTIAPDTAVLRETSGGSFAPTITAVAITDSDYNIIDDTNVSTGGGYIRITGTGFVSGCVVYIGGVAALSTTLLNSTQVNVQINATSSNTLHVYLVNPDGSAAIYLSGITFSGVPSWVTDSTIPGVVNEVAFSIGLSATSNSTVAYSLTAGSALPPGTTLTSAGVFSGTVSGLSADTTYSFSVTATDLELQDTPRTFSVTVAIGDPYLYLTPVLLNGESNVWTRDSSVNKLLPIVGGDTRPVAFGPYNSNWSTYFDGSNDDVRVGGNNNLAFGTGDFTIEMFFNSGIVGGSNQASFLYDGRTTSNPEIVPIIAITPSLTVTFGTGAATVVTSGTIFLNRWYHLVVSRVSGSTRMFLNGVQTGSTASDANNYLNNSGRPCIGTQGYGDPFFNYTGYISNLRVLKGTGTTSPTVPTAPLTAIENTQLLLFQSNIIKDNSTNGFAITAFADRPATKSFAPFVETDLITGSAYFDGTTDFLTIADNAALELGAGDFCVELWIHPTTVSGTGTIIDKRSGTYGPLLFWRFGATLQLYMSSNNSSWNLANGVTVGTVTANQWYHIAIYRVGSTIYSAFNGTVSTVTASGSATPHNNAGAWYFGTGTNGSGDPYTGYMSDMRFVIGSGVYTGSNFTPPATSLTAITNTQLLTLQYRLGNNNHRFVEESGVRALTTRAGNASQGSFSPHSPAGWSGYFDGTGDYLTVADNAALELGSNNFCVELFIYTTSVATDAILITKRASSADFAPILIWRNGAVIKAALSSNGSSWNVVDNVTLGTVIPNQWYHISVHRVGTAIYGSFNGTITTLNANTSASLLNNTSLYYIGSDSNLSPYAGYISNLRIVIGSSVYTGNTFTVPITALTAIANTQLLTLQDNRFKDNSSNAFTITRVADAKIQPFSPFREAEHTHQQYTVDRHTLTGRVTMFILLEMQQ